MSITMGLEHRQKTFLEAIKEVSSQRKEAADTHTKVSTGRAY